MIFFKLNLLLACQFLFKSATSWFTSTQKSIINTVLHNMNYQYTKYVSEFVRCLLDNFHYSALFDLGGSNLDLIDQNHAQYYF